MRPERKRKKDRDRLRNRKRKREKALESFRILNVRDKRVVQMKAAFQFSERKLYRRLVGLFDQWFSDIPLYTTIRVNTFGRNGMEVMRFVCHRKQNLINIELIHREIKRNNQK